MAKVLLVESPLAVRRALSTRLALEQDLMLVGEANDAQEAKRLVQRLQPEIVLLDAEMPGLDLAGLIDALGTADKRPAIVVLTMDAAALEYRFTDASITIVGKHAGMVALLAAIRAAARPSGDA